jgi:hypothetical protein
MNARVSFSCNLFDLIDDLQLTIQKITIEKVPACSLISITIVFHDEETKHVVVSNMFTKKETIDVVNVLLQKTTES